MPGSRYLVPLLVGAAAFLVGRRQGRSSGKTASAAKEEEKRAEELLDSMEAPEHKMVLVVRTDLGMSIGKTAAQAAHAAVDAVDGARTHCPVALRRWQLGGFKKIVVQVKSESKLRKLAEKAEAEGLNWHLTVDQGRTEIAPDSATVLAIGPAPNADVDVVTKRLKLLK